MNWYNLFESEREHFRDRARKLIESGIFQNYELEELAIMIYRKENE